MFQSGTYSVLCSAILLGALPSCFPNVARANRAYAAETRAINADYSKQVVDPGCPDGNTTGEYTVKGIVRLCGSMAPDMASQEFRQDFLTMCDVKGLADCSSAFQRMVMTRVLDRYPRAGIRRVSRRCESEPLECDLAHIELWAREFHNETILKERDDALVLSAKRHRVNVRRARAQDRRENAATTQGVADSINPPDVRCSTTNDGGTITTSCRKK